MIHNNLLYDITSTAIKNLRDEKRVVVWFGGRKALGVVNDCINIIGGKIDYAIVDNSINDQAPLDYKWNIPLINKHIHVDIKKSSLLSKYHIELNQPKAVDRSIVDVLGNCALYVISSNYFKEMSTFLKEKKIEPQNILELPSEDESIKRSEKRIAQYFDGRIQLSIKEIHEIEYQILRHFKTFCENNNLRYWLGGGTMLGAVRHNGFIPWDDDIDVFMPDADYRIFIEKYKDSDSYELLSYSRTEDYPFYFSKITDRRTIIRHLGYPIEYLMGVYIDVFPLVGYPKEKYEQENQWEMEHLTMAEWYWYKDLSAILGKEIMPITSEEIIKKMKLPPFDESEYVGQVSVILQKEWVSKREVFSKYVNKSFEDEEFRVPVGYDAHLRERYGDYMTLPPKEKREVHSFPMYR